MSEKRYTTLFCNKNRWTTRAVFAATKAGLRCLDEAEVQLHRAFTLQTSCASCSEQGTIECHMGDFVEECLHSSGLRAESSAEFRCPACETRLDAEGVERWVWRAEAARDEAYPLAEGDEFLRLVFEERQREVYRRRKVLYELRNISYSATARPEMILVSYDAAEDAYECRIFYKEPRPAWGPERIDVKAELDTILALRTHPDPNVRLVSGKVEEFHVLRESKDGQDGYSPQRRVFYKNEI